MTDADCPKTDSLRRLAQDVLEADDLETVLTHLEQCGICTEAFRTLSSKDPWTDTLRNAPPPADPADAEAVSRVIELLQRCGPASVKSLSDCEKAEFETQGGNCETSSVLPAISFLSPPTGPEELGRLGPYRVLSVLGSGGMGIVFEAEDTALSRRVALKVMQVADPLSKRRFLIEARATAAIEHENIVTIHQVGEAGGIPFLAMQLLRGESLDARLRRTPQLPLREALRIALETAQGLSAAHARQLIHRDIKPANIWLEAKGDRVKLVDFGLARDLAGDAHMTHTGALLGTPAYMSPEQVVGQAVEPRTDLFSLGCVLYQMLTGQQPFQGPNVMSLLTAVSQATPPAVTLLNPQAPPEAVRLVNRLLAKKPEDRPASSDEVVSELQRIIAAHDAAQVELAQPKTAERGHGGGRRWAWIAAAAAAFFLACYAGWVIIRDDRGQEVARFKIPNGGSATIQQEPAPQPAKAPTTAPVADAPGSAKSIDYAAERRFAEWAVTVADEIEVRPGGYIKPGQALPAAPFRVVRFSGKSDVKLDERDVARFDEIKGLNTLRLPGLKCKATAIIKDVARHVDVTELNIGGAEVTDADLETLLGLRKLDNLALYGNHITDNGLKLLANFAELKGLHLQQSPYLDGSGLRHLVGLPKLKHLNVENTNITDEGTAAIGQLKGLEFLAMHGGFTDAGLLQLGELTELRDIGFNESRITLHGAAVLGSLKKLETVNIGSAKLPDGIVDILAGLKNLKKVTLPKTISEAAVERLRRQVSTACTIDWNGKLLKGTATIATPPAAPVATATGSVKWPESARSTRAYFDAQRAFAEWAIGVGGSIGVNGNGTDLKKLDSLPSGPFRVVKLDLRKESAPAVTEADLARLDDVPELTQLILNDIPLTAATTRRIGQITHLRELQLMNGGLLDEGVRLLTGLGELENLTIRDSKLTDEVFEYFQALRKLKQLALLGCGLIRGNGMDRLAKLEGLEDLFLDGDLDDSALAVIGRLKTLKVLTVSGSFTDRGLEHLSGLTGLTRIGIGSSKITDAGLSKLLAGLRPTSVDLTNTPAREQVVDALCQQKQLRHIKLPNQVSEAAIERLHAAVPDALIELNNRQYKPTAAKP